MKLERKKKNYGWAGIIGLGIGAFLGILLLWFIVMSILSLIVNWGVGFVLDYEIGFWRTFVGLWILSILGNLVFKSNKGGSKE